VLAEYQVLAFSSGCLKTLISNYLIPIQFRVDLVKVNIPNWLGIPGMVKIIAEEPKVVLVYTPNEMHRKIVKEITY
jgi:hypothetical protein